MRIQTKCIRIKRRVIADDYFKEFTFHNINYRRYIYNLFVEEYVNCKDPWIDFNPDEICKNITEYIDKLSHDNKYYCSDIVKMVRHDIFEAFRAVKRNTIKNNTYNTLNFKSFDRYRGSFNIPSRNEFNKHGNLQGKVNLNDRYTICFRASKTNHFKIYLKESIYDEKSDDVYYIYNKNRDVKYMFMHSDIKEITFLHELGQFFILLCIEVSYVIDDDSKPNNIAGIDLGIHNPVTIYDGKNTIFIHMSNRELNRIHYLERRCGRLNTIMNRKTYESNNYEKVRRKFRRTWKRIYDIRRNWRKQLANKLSKYYKIICLDEFKQPTSENTKYLPTKVKRYLNHFNREHGMSYFIKDIKHACEKNSCLAIEAPKKTTRTCSCCGHENPKLPLSKRILHCEKCGIKIDRDINAAMNCYDYLIRTNIRNNIVFASYCAGI